MIVNYIIAFSSVILTSALGSLFTSKNTKTPWYNCIRPDITPPNYVFPIVWTILYILLGLAFAFSLNSKLQIINFLFVATFIFNILWSYFYFSKKAITAAFAILILLIAFAIAIIVLAYKVNKKIVYLVIPYLVWITFASILNYLSIEKAKKCI